MGGGTASEPLIITSTTRSATAEECSDGGIVTVFSHSLQEITDAIASGRPTYVQDAALYPAKSLFPVIEAVLPSDTIRGSFTFLTAWSGSAAVSKMYFDDASSKEIIDCGGIK